MHVNSAFAFKEIFFVCVESGPSLRGSRDASFSSGDVCTSGTAKSQRVLPEEKKGRVYTFQRPFPEPRGHPYGCDLP